MGIFTKDQKLEQAPRTAGSVAGEKRLTELIGRPDPTLPTQGTAGLTDVQREVQRRLGGTPESISEAARLATGKFRDTLEGGRDPLTSPAFESYRRLAEELKTGAVTSTRQAAQQQGGTRSTAALGAEATTARKFDTQILAEAGRLLEIEEDRKLQAAAGIQGAAGEEVRGLRDVTGAADIERQIEQQRATALYQQALAQIMFPYDKVAGIATALMNFQPDTVVTGGGLTDLGFAASAVAGGVTAAAGAGAFGGGGGGSTN